MRFAVFSFLLLAIGFFGETVQAQTEEKEKKVVFQPELSFRSFWMNTSYSNEVLRSDYALGLTSPFKKNGIYKLAIVYLAMPIVLIFGYRIHLPAKRIAMNLVYSMYWSPKIDSLAG